MQGLVVSIPKSFELLIFIFFSVRLLSVLRGHSVFHPRHNSQWPPTLKDFYPRFYPLHFFPYLDSSERANVSFFMLSAKQGNYGVSNVYGSCNEIYCSCIRRETMHSSSYIVSSCFKYICSYTPLNNLLLLFSGHFLGNNTVVERLREKGFDIEHTLPYAKIPK